MADADAALDPVLMLIGDAMEKEAKVRVRGGGAHRAGTKTPARRGGGPAVITGDLARAVTHELAGSHTVRVGAADIPHRPAKAGWKAPKATSGEIGGYVEKLGFEWLTPAAETVIAAAEATVGDALDVALRW